MAQDIRLIDYTLSKEEQRLVAENIKRKTYFWLNTRSIAEDLVAMINFSAIEFPQRVVSFTGVYELAGKVYSNQIRRKTAYTTTFATILEEFFVLRRDLIKLGNSYIISSLRLNRELPHEEKVKILLEVISKFLDSFFKQKIAEKRKKEQQNKKQDEPEKSKEESQEEQEREDSVFKELEDELASLSPHDKSDIADGESLHDSIGNFSGSGDQDKGQPLYTKKDYLRDLPGIANTLYRKGHKDILDLAHNFDAVFKDVDSTDVRDQHYGTAFRYRRMRSLSDMRYMKFVDLVLDEDEFDSKLAQKSFIIKQPEERYQKRQLLYILADISGSMHGNRALFMQAVMIALGKDILKNKGTIYFRWFDNSCSSLIKITSNLEWAKYLSYIVNVNIGGGTYLVNALQTAGKDLDYSEEIVDDVEVLVITDGDESISKEVVAETLGEVNSHVVLLDKLPEDRLEEYKESFTSVTMSDIGYSSSIQEIKEKGLNFLKIK